MHAVRDQLGRFPVCVAFDVDIPALIHYCLLFIIKKTNPCNYTAFTKVYSYISDFFRGIDKCYFWNFMLCGLNFNQGWLFLIIKHKLNCSQAIVVCAWHLLSTTINFHNNVLHIRTDNCLDFWKLVKVGAEISFILCFSWVEFRCWCKQLTSNFEWFVCSKNEW